MQTRIRKYSLSAALIVFSCLLALGQNSKVIQIKTQNTELVYAVDQNQQLVLQYYGKAVDAPEAFHRQKSYTKPDTNRNSSSEVYPAFGHGYVKEPMKSACSSGVIERDESETYRKLTI